MFGPEWISKTRERQSNWVAETYYMTTFQDHGYCMICSLWRPQSHHHLHLAMWTKLQVRICTGSPPSVPPPASESSFLDKIENNLLRSITINVYDMLIVRVGVSFALLVTFTMKRQMFIYFWMFSFDSPTYIIVLGVDFCSTLSVKHHAVTISKMVWLLHIQ